MNLIKESLAFGLCVLPILLLAGMVTRPRHFFYAFIFLFLLVLDDFLSGLPLAYDILSIPGADWNWVGKMFSLALSLSVIGMSSFSFKDIGLAGRQRVGSVLPASLVTIIFIMISVIAGFEFLKSSTFTTEAFWYKTTIQVYAEELAYRGLFLSLLHRAFPARPRSFTYWWPAIITTLAFGLWHGVEVEGLQISFDVLAFLYPCFSGAVFAWLRERTGSLLFPVIAHSFSNAAVLLVGIT